jgi:hypothetical protein
MLCPHEPVPGHPFAAPVSGLAFVNARLRPGIPLGEIRPHTTMNKLCIFGGTTVFGYAGWFVGELLGFDFFGCFLLSGLGSILGVWLGWKLAQKLAE